MHAVILCMLLAPQVFTLGFDRDPEVWNVFKMEYNKSYPSTTEETRRRQIFSNNEEFIRKHNDKFEKGEVNYTMKVNEFSDMTTEEFLAKMTGLRVPEGLRPSVTQNLTVPDMESASTEIDWRMYGAVTGVKNQGQCGSCWIFSATGSLEAQHFFKTKQLVSLSEQNIMDCGVYPHPCNGGWMAKVFEYTYKNRGIDTEWSYPYTGREGGACHFNPNTVGATVTGYVQLPAGNEESLKYSVANVGPVSVCVDATQNFVHYSGGVFNDPTCTTTINHAVLVVGYGTDPRGGDYWLIKNSWGTSWGTQGYIKMSRNRGNQCGIASWGIYPTV